MREGPKAHLYKTKQVIPNFIDDFEGFKTSNGKIVRKLQLKVNPENAPDLLHYHVKTVVHQE